MNIKLAPQHKIYHSAQPETLIFMTIPILLLLLETKNLLVGTAKKCLEFTNESKKDKRNDFD